MNPMETVILSEAKDLTPSEVVILSGAKNLVFKPLRRFTSLRVTSAVSS